MEIESLQILQSKKNLLLALKKTLGVITPACEMCNLSRQTYYEWLKTDSIFAQAVEEIKAEQIDFVEGKLFTLINGAEIEEDKVFCYQGQIITQKVKKKFAPSEIATTFYLRTKGKKQGYQESTELTGKDGAPLNASPIEDLSTLTDDELKLLIELQAKIRAGKA